MSASPTCENYLGVSPETPIEPVACGTDSMWTELRLIRCVTGDHPPLTDREGYTDDEWAGEVSTGSYWTRGDAWPSGLHLWYDGCELSS